MLICGKEYPVVGHAKRKNGEIAPLVDIPMMSDYTWQLRCLESRLEHPEHYAQWENVEETIARLRKWLADHEEVKEMTA